MDKKSKNTLIVSIIALALVLIGVTYAYFSARITGLESASTLSLTAGRMGIVYSEGDENVSVSNIYPREEEWLTKTITLTGYNTTNQEMKYELGINIITNTFKGGELTYSLTGVGSNGTRIADIEGKSLVGQNHFLKIGTGVFNQADGDTHVYTLKIWFKDTGRDQNYNQEAIFNGKIHVKEYKLNIATPVVAAINTTNQNHSGKHCYTSGYQANVNPTDGLEYIDGQYTYKYNYRNRSYYNNQTRPYGYVDEWVENASQNGWGVKLTDKDSTSAVNTELCAYIDEKPVTNMDYMFANSKATSIDLSSFDTSNVTNMGAMFKDASNLRTIYTSNNFVTSALGPDNAYNSGSFSSFTGSHSMFDGCTSLVGGAGTTYNSSKTNKEYAHIDGCVSNPGYFTLKTN